MFTCVNPTSVSAKNWKARPMSRVKMADANQNSNVRIDGGTVGTDHVDGERQVKGTLAVASDQEVADLARGLF